MHGIGIDASMSPLMGQHVDYTYVAKDYVPPPGSVSVAATGAGAEDALP